MAALASRIIAPPIVLLLSAGCQVTLSPPRRHALTLPLACTETSAQTHHQPSRSQPHRGGPFQAPQQTGHKRQARLHRSTVSSADIPLAQSIPPTQGVAPSVVYQLHKVERGGDMMVSWGRRLCGPPSALSTDHSLSLGLLLRGSMSNLTLQLTPTGADQQSSRYRISQKESL